MEQELKIIIRKEDKHKTIYDKINKEYVKIERINASGRYRVELSNGCTCNEYGLAGRFDKEKRYVWNK